MSIDVFYKNDPLLPAIGSTYDYTEDEILEIQRCFNNPIYFVEKYVKIVSLDRGLIDFKLYDYQKKMIKLFADNRYCLGLSSRQSGKCCYKSTEIKVRNKSGKEYTLTCEYFYEWMNFREKYKDTVENLKSEQ
jgi:hypothetical protein